jgi:AraC family transcriptional regulator
MIERLSAREHFGLVQVNRTFRDFAISTVRYASHSTTPPHTNENALLGFVLNGAYSKDIGRNNEVYLESGSFFFIAAGQYQADTFGPDTDCLLVDCAPAFVSRLPLGRERTLCLSDGEIGSLQAQIRKELRHEDACSEILCESLILKAFGTAVRRHQDIRRPRCPDWLIEFRRALEAHAHKRLRVAEIARLLGVHPVHAHQQFKRFFNCTPGEFVRRERVELAKAQLLMSELSVDSISHATGFCDRSHFARVFMKAVGLSPTDYRATAPKASRPPKQIRPFGIANDKNRS